MPRNYFLLWLLMELGRFYLTPAASETVVTGYLGQTVKLPCQHPSWSRNSNSMCWGKGECPKSKCKNELVHTDGTRVISRTSSRYNLRGTISQGDLSLTISSTRERDSGVYCCRIEVPGWFNDMKKNIRLQLKRVPVPVVPPKTTTRQPTTTTIKMTEAWTPSTTLLPTTKVSTPDLTTEASLQITTGALTTCPLNTESTPPATPTNLATETTTPRTLATEPATEGAMYTSAEAEVAPTPVLPQRPSSTTSGALHTTSLSSREPQSWHLPSRSTTTPWNVSHMVTFSVPGASEMEILPEEQMEVEQIQMTDPRDLLMIVIPSLGLLLFVVLLGIFLRGKIMKTVWFQKHTRLKDSMGSGQDLGGMQPRREDEDGLFTL